MDTLDHIILRVAPNGNGVNAQTMLASSGTLSPADATLWQGLIALDPFPATEIRETEAVGLFKGPDGDSILSRALFQDGEHTQSLYQHIRVHKDTLQILAGNIASFIEVTEEFLGEIPENGLLAPLKVPPVPTWTADKRMALFERALEEYGDMTVLFRLLGATLHERRLMIRGYEGKLYARLNLVQALLMLLPSSVRPEITFSTYVQTPPTNRAMLIFCDSPMDAGRFVFDFGEEHVPDDSVLDLPYIDALRMMWKGDLKLFIADLRAMEFMAAPLMEGKTIKDGLNAVAERFKLDTIVMLGEDVPHGSLKHVLRDSPPQNSALLTRYVEQLLKVALQERDAEAVNILVTTMHTHEDVRQQVEEYLGAMLENQPDAVYFFARSVLNGESYDFWLPLLQLAAVISMSIVIQDDGEAETVMAWLRLIANEPASYQMHTILRDGILAAQSLTHHNPELGRRLVAFAARRVPELMPDLLADEPLIAVMEDPLGAALRMYAPEAVRASLEINRELSLYVLAEALNAAPHNLNAAAVFSPPVVDYLWGLVSHEEFPHLPENVQPLALIERLVSTGRGWVMTETVDLLMKRAVHQKATDFYLRLVMNLLPPTEVFSAVLSSLNVQGLDADTVIEMTRALMDNHLLTTQQAVDVYLRVVAHLGWKGEICLRLVEQVARLFQQNAALNAPSDALNTMLDFAAETKSDLIARVVARRVLSVLEAMDDDTAQISALAQTANRINWSNSARAQMMAWWRDYARTQSIPRLQAWDRALDGRKGLEWARSVAQTALAFRKMIGKRTLEEFADAIGNAYSVLQALSDSFDASRSHFTFDPLTVRDELDSRGDELTPDERSVLAKNLRELAELVTQMAENRSKSTLIRREEDIERQLLSGDQAPQSAIDTMRWLSGYLSGLQGEKD